MMHKSKRNFHRLICLLLICVLLLPLFLIACNRNGNKNEKQETNVNSQIPGVMVPLSGSYFDESMMFDCDPQIEFEIYDEGSVIVNSQNLYSHVVVTDKYGNWVEIGVENKHDTTRNRIIFTVPEGYAQGQTFTISIASGVYFAQKDRSVRSVTFTISPSESYVSEIKGELKFISPSSVISFGEDYLTVSPTDIEVGDVFIVAEQDSDYDLSTFSYLAEDVETVDAMTRIKFTAADVTDVYEKLDISTKSDIDCTQIDYNNLDIEPIESQIRESQAFYALASALEDVYYYDSIQPVNALEPLALPTPKPKSEGGWIFGPPSLTIKPDFLKGLKVNVKVLGFNDFKALFENAEEYLNKGIGLQITISWSGQIHDYVKLNVELSYAIVIRLEYKTYMQLKFFSLDVDNHIKATSTNKLHLKVTVGGNKDPKLLKQQIQESYNRHVSDKSVYNSYDDYIRGNYANRSGYVEKDSFLFIKKPYAQYEHIKTIQNTPHLDGFEWKIPILKTEFLVPYTPIAIKPEVGLFISLNMQIELDVDATYTEIFIAGVRSGENGLEPYNYHEAFWKFNELVLQGKIEFNAGVYLQVGIGIAFVKIFEVGIEGKASFYIDICGELYLREDEHSNLAAGGAAYLEIGLKAELSGYWEVNLLVFKASGKFLTLTWKQPLVFLGTDAIWLDFNNGVEDPMDYASDSYEIPFEMKSRKTKLDIASFLIVRRFNLRTLDFDYYLPSFEEIGFEWVSGDVFDYQNGEIVFVSSDKTQSLYNDQLVIYLKEHKEVFAVLDVSYLNTIALESLKIDEHGAVYELNASGLTYSLKSVPSGVQNYTVAVSIERLPVVAIQANAFAGNRTIRKVTLHSDIKEIGDYAFFGCTSLLEIDLCNVTSLGTNAFNDCRSLNYIILGNLDAIKANTFEGCASLTTIDLPASLKTIADYAFMNTGLNSIVIPSGVINIGYAAFGDSDALNLAYFKGSVMPAFVGNPFVLSNTNLYVIVPTTAHTNYANYFGDYGISVGTEANIVGDFVVAIDGGSCIVKYYFGMQRDVVIPSTLGGKTVVMIGQRAFGNQIETLVLPSTIQGIDSFAFRDARNLVSITFNSTTPPILGGMVFANGNPALTIYVPQNTLQSYITSPYWVTWANINGFIRTQK